MHDKIHEDQVVIPLPGKADLLHRLFSIGRKIHQKTAGLNDLGAIAAAFLVVVHDQDPAGNDAQIDALLPGALLIQERLLRHTEGTLELVRQPDGGRHDIRLSGRGQTVKLNGPQKLPQRVSYPRSLPGNSC